jgi:hypothetical protein
MIATAMTFFDVVLFFHILAVVLAFGPTFAYGVFFAVAGKEGGRAIPTIGRAIRAWDTAQTPLILVILASGIYMTSDRYDYGFFFVSWGFIAVIAILALIHGFFRPQTTRVVELAERDIAATPGDGPVEFSPEFEAVSNRLARGGQLTGVLIVLTIYFMTAKPFSF